MAEIEDTAGTIAICDGNTNVFEIWRLEQADAWYAAGFGPAYYGNAPDQKRPTSGHVAKRHTGGFNASFCDGHASSSRNPHSASGPTGRAIDTRMSHPGYGAHTDPSFRWPPRGDRQRWSGGWAVYVRPYRWLVAATVACAVISLGFGLLYPKLTGIH